MVNGPEIPLLRMAGVSKSFGGTQALRNVSFAVQPGEVHALIGENGAGKSTLMKILSGAIAADSGTMELAGQTYAPRGPHAARQAGVAMIYQELNLAPELTIEENIMLGQEQHRWGWIDHRVQQARLQAALSTLGHGDLPSRTPVRELTPGMKQLVEIARALVSQARVIVFDEPTSSLTQHDAERLFVVIDRLRKEGIAVVYISHFLEEIRRVCQSFTVLRDGATAGSGTVASVTEPDIVALMVGRSVEELFPTVPHQPGEAILSLENIRGEKLPRNVSLELRRGEIFGLFGLVGAGRTETLRLMFGLDRQMRGTMTLQGKPLTGSPRSRIRSGLGLVSEDRKGEGLAQARSLADNMTYSRLQPYSWHGWLTLTRRNQAVRDWMQRLKIKAAHGEVEVQSLSGGNQQKVAIARVLHQEAEILLLDEPTRGIDVGTKAEIYRLMGEQAAAGRSVIFVSSYLPELLAVSDRVGIMSRGKLTAIRPASEWTEQSALTEALRANEEV